MILTQTIAKGEEPTPQQLRFGLLMTGAILVCVLLGVAAILGGMKYCVLALAVALAVLVWQCPKEAISAGVLYLIACNVLLPSAVRFDWQRIYLEPWEMYYWASGIFLITFAAAARIGIRELLQIPASAKAFLFVAIAATFVGLEKGASLSYALRQFYGSLLFVLYFAFAFRGVGEQIFLRRLRDIGLLLASIFFAYYAVVFSQYGFHKEITSIGTLFGVAGIISLVIGLEKKQFSWIVSGVVFFGVPVLLFWRHMIIAIAFGIALALGARAASKARRFFWYAAAALIFVPSVFPEGAAIVIEKLTANALIEQILPGGAGDVSSLVDRNVQLLAALEVLHASPLLGSGFGSELEWDSATRGAFSQAYVDNGWAYVGVKMGILGLVVFGWLLFTVLRCLSRDSLAISVAFLTMVLVVLFSEPVFFQFTTSPLGGALAGLLCARRTKKKGIVVASPALRQGQKSLLSFENGVARA